jgi:hypothetical protein
MNSTEAQSQNNEKEILEVLKILHDELRHTETIFIRTITILIVILTGFYIVARQFLGNQAALIFSAYFSVGLFIISLQFYNRINLLKEKQENIFSNNEAPHKIQESFYKETLSFKGGNEGEGISKTNFRQKLSATFIMIRTIFRNTKSNKLSLKNFHGSNVILNFKKIPISILILFIFLIQLFVAFAISSEIIKYILLFLLDFTTIYIIYTNCKKELKRSFAGQILAVDILFSSYVWIFLFTFGFMLFAFDFSLFNIKHEIPKTAKMQVSLMESGYGLKLVTSSGYIYKYMTLPGKNLPSFVSKSLKRHGRWTGYARLKKLTNLSSSDWYVTADIFTKKHGG